MEKAKPDDKIMLDRERVIRFDLNAMCEFEKATGRKLFDGTFIAEKMSAEELRYMLWSCLLDEDPTITAKQAGRLIGTWNMSYVTSKLNGAYQVAVPTVKGKSDGPLLVEEVPVEEVPVEAGSTG